MSSILASTNPQYYEPFDEYLTGIKQRTDTSEYLTNDNPILTQDEDGVVDKNLSIYRTGNVQIGDGSMFPHHPSAQPKRLAYTLAVRAGMWYNPTLCRRAKLTLGT
jgi:hypothetical protein